MKSLSSLQNEEIPRASIDSIGSVKKPETFKRELVDGYLQSFVDPAYKQDTCLMCGEPLYRFVYGIQHGEGTCGNCGYPARADHYIMDGEDVYLSLHVVLRYHPSELKANGS